MKNNSVSDFEMQNIVLVSKLVIEAALERKESRGRILDWIIKKLTMKIGKKHNKKKNLAHTNREGEETCSTYRT